MAAALSKYVPGMHVTAESTGGPVDNMKLIDSGKAYLGFALTDIAQDAARGEGRFSGKQIPVKTLAVLYPNRMHVVTVEGTGINTFADLRGKRVSTGAPGSATEVMAFRVIEAAGMDRDRDMRRERLSVGESVNSIKAGKIDAFFWVGGIPTAAVQNLADTPETKLKLIDHSHLVPAMNRKFGNLYVEDTIPRSSYSGMSADNKQATIMTILVAHENMDDRTAYNIVKTIFDKKADLVAVRREAEGLDLHNQNAAATSIPFHPGAVKFLAERNIGWAVAAGGLSGGSGGPSGFASKAEGG